MPTYKGSYDESMTAAIAAFRAGNAPHILQVFEVGTATMMASKGAIVPVGKVHDRRRPQVRPDGLHPGGGRLLHRAERPDAELPVQQLDARSSTTTRTPSRPPASTPNKPPTTWPEVALAAAKLKASGHKCPFTTSWQGWTQLESFSTWHNVEFATKNNGFGGIDARLAFNTPLHVRHIENLANMAKQGLFVYKGRGNAADATFVSGECAMTTASSALYGNIKKNAKFDFGIATAALLPRRARRAAEHRDRRRQPVGDVGQEARRVQGRGRVLQLPVQRRGARPRATSAPATCRSPLASFELTEKSGFYKQNPGTDVAVNQMIRKTTDKSRGIRLGNFVQIRTIDRRGARAGLGRQEDRQGSARRGRQARQRAARALREGQQGLNAAPARRRARARSGRRKARRLPIALAALGAARAPGGRHRSCSSSGRPAQALLQSLQQSGRLRHLGRMGRAGELPQPVERRDLPRVVQDHRGVLGAGGGAGPVARRCCWRCSPTAWSAARRSTRRC